MQLAIFCVIKNQALELSWGHDARVFLSWTRSRSPANQEDHKVALSRQLGEKLGLRDGEQVMMSHSLILLPIPQTHQALITPLFLITNSCWMVSGLLEVVPAGPVCTAGVCGATLL
jgi:hypothetical protein